MTSSSKSHISDDVRDDPKRQDPEISSDLLVRYHQQLALSGPAGQAHAAFVSLGGVLSAPPPGAKLN